MQFRALKPYAYFMVFLLNLISDIQTMNPVVTGDEFLIYIEIDNRYKRDWYKIMHIYQIHRVGNVL